jgi:hypothetical protein
MGSGFLAVAELDQEGLRVGKLELPSLILFWRQWAKVSTRGSGRASNLILPLANVAGNRVSIVIPTSSATCSLSLSTAMPALRTGDACDRAGDELG